MAYSMEERKQVGQIGHFGKFSAIIFRQKRRSSPCLTYIPGSVRPATANRFISVPRTKISNERSDGMDRPSAVRPKAIPYPQNSPGHWPTQFDWRFPCADDLHCSRVRDSACHGRACCAPCRQLVACDAKSSKLLNSIDQRSNPCSFLYGRLLLEGSSLRSICRFRAAGQPRASRSVEFLNVG